MTVVVLALLAGALAVVDVVVRQRVQAAVAAKIESRFPGSHAVVSISSFPFVGRLAASGTVPSLQADVTGVAVSGLRFAAIDVAVTDLKVSRSRLVHGELEPLSIRHGQVVAEISQSALDSFSRVPVTLGAGTIGMAGVSLPARITVGTGVVTLSLSDGLASLRVPVPALDILPCVGSAQVVPGLLRLSCSFRALPGFLAGATFR